MELTVDKTNYKSSDNVSPKTVQNLCRACLKQLKQRQKFEILNLSTQKRQCLKDISIENPLALEFYPNSICLSCRKKLNKVVEFHEMFRQSTKTLQKILARDDFKMQEEAIIKLEEPDYLTEAEVKTEPTLNIIDIEEPLISCERSKNIEENNDIKDVCDTKDYKDASQEQLDLSDFESSNSTENFSEVSTTKRKRQKYKYLFNCKVCECLCMSQQTLDIHKRIHNGLKPYQCPKCEKSFDKSTLMLKHLDEIHNERKLSIICEYKGCGNQFTSYRSYKNHYREFHIEQQTSKRHVCEECGKTYAKMQIFKEHLYTHGPKELYPFQCNECDKAFVKEAAFNEHKLRHAGIKNFECSHCGAKKTTKKELRNHMNYHTKERPYPCPHCSMIFYTSTNRRVHVDVVHQGMRRFSCRYCDKTFAKGDNLKKHELLHTGEKPHECMECGKRFVQKVSLRSHMKTHK